MQLFYSFSLKVQHYLSVIDITLYLHFDVDVLSKIAKCMVIQTTIITILFIVLGSIFLLKRIFYVGLAKVFIEQQ